MTRLRVIVDMDGILVDFMGGIWKAYEKLTGERGDTSKVTGWDAWGVSDPSALESCFHEPGFFLGLEPLPGALEALQSFIADGHEVVICTAPCTPHSASEKLQWLAVNAPFIDPKDVFVAHRKHLLAGDVLIDDGAHNAVAFRAHHPGSLICTVGYPYNEGWSSYDLWAPSWETPESAWKLIVQRVSERAQLMQMTGRRSALET